MIICYNVISYENLHFDFILLTRMLNFAISKKERMYYIYALIFIHMNRIYPYPRVWLHGQNVLFKLHIVMLGK